MKSKCLLVFFAFLFAAAGAHASDVILPDACGKEEVQFDVKTLKGDSSPAPDPTKAELVFIETTQRGSQTIRYGLDGAWAGANKGNSYFIVWVTPGEHHLCASWQSLFKKSVNNYTGMASFTAEAGKVYYFEYKLSISMYGGGGGGFVQGSNSPFAPAGTPPPAPTYVPGSAGAVSTSSFFGPVTEDEGKYRMKASPISTATPKK